MSSGQIRFAPDILRRLGEELNPNIDQGILELVKNSYDANARHCVVRLKDTTAVGGRIDVEDDGDGMTEEEILNGWFILGSSPKSAIRRTRLGRIPAGNKGLGRLAALRLGTKTTMITRPRQGDSEYVVRIDWARYDKAKLVEDVDIPIEIRPRSSDRPGTEISIIGLRDSLGRMAVKRLARAMILLADPFSDTIASFEPSLQSPEFADLEQLVRDRYFNDADYHLVAKLNGGLVSAKVVDWRGQTLFEDSHREIASARKGQIYETPDSDFDLWAFVLTRDRFSTRTSTLNEVRSWIDVFGGVHLYLNGLRVAPYGNPGNDWLDMNLRRVQSPEERPSTNTSIGRVSVEDTEEVLRQKTDRSGFIEGNAFEELRSFARDSLDWMARVRLQAAESRRRSERDATKKQSSRSRENLREQIGKTSGSVRAELEQAFHRYDREREREANALRREVQLYRTLSTAGITAATFAHESHGNPLKVISQAIGSIELRSRRKAPELYEKDLSGPIESIKHSADSLGVLSAATLQLIDADKRRHGRVDLQAVIRGVLETFDPFFKDLDVRVLRDFCAAEPFLMGSEAAVESIVTNFINNSLSAFEAGGTLDRIISIGTSVIESTWRLRFSDSGPGIEGISTKAIWLPGETRRPNGTGLGLTIVRDAVSDLGGSASTDAHGPLGGATFTVELPILGT